MVTLLLQSILDLPKLAFGLTAVAASRRIPESGSRAAWWWVGMAFALSAVDGLLQSAGAIWAYHAGSGTEVYDLYLRWAPAANYSRSFLSIALAGVLIALGLPSLARRLPSALLLLPGAVALGIVFGLIEGPLEISRHAPRVAALDTVEMWVFCAALLVGAARSSLDRLLWLALALYSIRQALNVLWVSAIAHLPVPGTWIPHEAVNQFMGTLLWSAMVALVSYRLHLARRGIPVPALLEPARSRDASMMGWK